MTDIGGRQLWEEIVQMTDAPGCEYARSLRVALFIWLQQRDRDPLPRQARRMVSSVRTMFPMFDKTLPTVNKGRLVFCFAHGTPANMHNLLPVAREADRRDMLGGIVAARNLAAQLKEFSGRVPIVDTRSLVSQLSLSARHKIAIEAVRTFREICAMLDSHDARLSQRFRRNAGSAFEEIVSSIQMARAFQILFDVWSPSCVVSTSDLWPMEYQFAYQSSTLGIPSVVIQHGLTDDCWWPFQADLLITWGDVFNDKMTELGTPADRLAVGGMPSADDIFRRQNSQSVGTPSSGVHERPVCLVLSHTQGRVVEPEIFERFKAVFSETVRLTPEVRWKVKLHPSEEESFYRELDLDVFQRLEIYPRSTSLVEAVNSADVITTLFSASGLEAMIMGRPVIVPMVTPRVTELAWWPQFGGGIYVKNAEEFRESLMDLVSSSQNRCQQLESQRSFVKRAFANPGHASQTIVDLLISRSKLGRAQRFASEGVLA